MLLAVIHLLVVTEMGLCRSLLIMQDNYVVGALESLSSFFLLFKSVSRINMNFPFTYEPRNFEPRSVKTV